jgi:hypothetical protein
MLVSLHTWIMVPLIFCLDVPVCLYSPKVVECLYMCIVECYDIHTKINGCMLRCACMLVFLEGLASLYTCTNEL